MFEWLLKYPESDFNAGTLTFESGFPLWLLPALVVLVAIVLGVSLWRQRSRLSAAKLSTLWILQTLAASVLLTLIWQPALSVKTVRAGENSVAVLVDNSASMHYQNEGTTRIQQALDTINDDIVPSLSNTFTLSYATVGETLEPTADLSNPGPASNRSNITGSLLEVLDQARAEPLAAIIIATDGSDNSQAFASAQNTGDVNFWEQLAGFNVPVHTLGIGRESMPEDMEVTDVELAATTLPGSVERATVTVRHGGAATNQSARVKVYAGDNIIAIEDRKLPVEAGQITVDIDIDASDAGLQELRFEVEAASTDTVVENNSRNRLLQVEEKQRRILYFEGEPRWEYKFIRRAVSNSRGVALVTILRTTPNKFYRQGISSPEQHANGFPVTKAELYAYDAVIIGNVEAISLNTTQHQLLHDYVSERGGALLMLAGSNALADGGWHNSPLAKALPIEITPQGGPTYERIRTQATLTTAGIISPITRLDPDPDTNNQLWQELPQLADFQRTGPLKPGANTLLRAQLPDGDYPLLTYQQYGNGNSYVLASSGTWRWQMQMPSEDQSHEIFWQQLLQTIGATATSRMTVATDQQIYLDNSTLKVSANLLSEDFEPDTNSTVSANITSPDGSTRSIELSPNPQKAGEFVATVNAEATGNWQLDISARNADQQVAAITRWIHREDGSAESYGLPQNASFLKRVASTTGGQYWTTSSADDIPAAIRAARSGIVRLQSLPLWNMPLFFILLLGLKLLEWLLRMSWGRL